MDQDGCPVRNDSTLIRMEKDGRLNEIVSYRGQVAGICEIIITCLGACSINYLRGFANSLQPMVE